VRTASGIVEDVGTAFVVARYPESAMLRVGVASGRVIVRGKRDGGRASGNVVASDTLKRGDVFRLMNDGGSKVEHGVDVAQELAWTTGKLVFDRAPLGEVVPRLARWFDADIRLADSALGNVAFTGTFGSEPVGQVLELLAASVDARVQRDRGAYVLRGKPEVRDGTRARVP
jgi:ferric-dicitrate binding protein FerR (iron transport regulator)